MLALVGLVAVPLAAAPLLFVAGRRFAPWLPLLAAIATVGCLLAVASDFDGAVVYHLGDWPPPLGIAWRLDTLSLFMLATVALVGLVVVLFAAVYLPRTGARRAWKEFWPALLLLWAALNAMFLSGDAFNIYVTLELAGIAAVALVTVGGQAAALAAGMRYLLFTLFGSISYLLGVVLLYRSHGALDLELLAQNVVAGPQTAAVIALVTVGLFAKSALFPLHVWLPPAHGNAPTPASAMLSALVVMASFYVLLRLLLNVFPTVLTPEFRQLIGLLGAGGVVWGSLLALQQDRIKLLVAYSTVAQLGYLLLVLPLAQGPSAASAWAGTVWLALSHAFAKAAMFLGSGVLLMALGHDRVDAIQGAARVLPMTIFAFGLAGLTLMGLPPSGGFLAKWLLLQAAFDGGQWWWGLVPLGGGLLAAGYVFRILLPAFAGAREAPAITPVPRVLEVLTLLLALTSVLMGLVAAKPLALLMQTAPGGFE